jgi:hypothetical protein
LLDKLLGRQIFIPASAANALSDDRERLVVPDEIAEIASRSIDELIEAQNSVRSYSAGSGGVDVDKTVVVPFIENDDETVVRFRDDDETVVRTQDGDDETVLRWRRRAK